MKHSEVLAYVYNFVSILIENEKILNSINTIILFDSVARGNFDKNSDVDLFIDIKSLDKKKDVEQLLKEATNTFETQSTRTWHLRGIDLPIKIICGKLEEPVWENLENEIISTGIVIYGKYEKTPKNLQQYALISYTLTKLKQHKKMQFLRQMYGYRIKKNRKIYTQKGELSEIGGEKLTTNQFIIKIRDAKIAIDKLKKFKIPYTIQEVWITK